MTVTFLFAILGVKIGRIAPEKEIQAMPEKADFRGVGGHRIGTTEHEAAVREA